MLNKRILMPGILDIFKKDTLKSVGDIVDNVVTNSEEKSQAKKELTEVVLGSLNKLAAVQGEVIMTEMKGSWLQRNWRPLMMANFGIILTCKWFGWTDAEIDTELELELMSIIKLGLGGYVIGRSSEQIAKTVTKNIDIPFLKKKNRKNR